MKKIGNWLLSIIGKTAVILIVILLLPYAGGFFRNVFPDLTGGIMTQSRIIEQKLESSQRLEVTRIDEEGVLDSRTSVIILGEVGSTIIRYRYTASAGIDLGKVIMTVDTDRIIFLLPEVEVLNDGIEALEVNKHNWISRRIDKSTEELLSEQRLKCREQYLNDSLHTQKVRDDACTAFDETICQWLDSSGGRHFEFEIRFQDEMAAD